MDTGINWRRKKKKKEKLTTEETLASAARFPIPIQLVCCHYFLLLVVCHETCYLFTIVGSFKRT